MTRLDVGTFREVTGTNTDEYLGIQSVTYNDNQPWADDPPVVDRRLFIFDRIEKGVGAYCGLEFGTIVGHRVLSTIGYNMVSILPEHRNGGNGRAMMEKSLVMHALEGKALAVLYGFSEAFYRQFGFEVGGSTQKVKCEIGYLPKTRQTLPVKRLEPSDWARLSETYQRFARMRSGMIHRTEFWWQRTLKGKAIFTFGDPIAAYIVVNLKTAFYAPLEVSEFLGLSRLGYESAYAFLKKLAINKSSVTWVEGADSPFLHQFVHTGGMNTIEIGSKPMFRGLNVIQLLAGLHASSDFQLVVNVSDPIIEANNGVFEVKSIDGLAVVTPNSTLKSELNVTISELTMLVIGAYNPNHIAARLSETISEGTQKKLEELFPYRSPTCLNYF